MNFLLKVSISAQGDFELKKKSRDTKLKAKCVTISLTCNIFLKSHIKCYKCYFASSDILSVSKRMFLYTVVVFELLSTWDHIISLHW